METTSAHLRLSRSKEIPRPNAYVKALDGDFSEWAFNEERALHLKGFWREKVFGHGTDYPVDLEVGTGNGYFFAHRCQVESDRGLVGIEIKFKPLIQTIRRALRGGASNARVARFNASLVDLLFEDGELNNIFIHHPDPWDKKKKHKHRLIQDSYLAKLFQLQRSDCFLEFKTDSRDYFDWSVERFKRSSYRIGGLTYDLHRSEFGQNNFVTHFEQIFTRQGHPIHYAILHK